MGWPMEFPKTNGACACCGKIVSKAGMTRHLQSCAARAERLAQAAGDKRAQELRLLHLAIDGADLPCYWLHVQIAGDTTLTKLDKFLRDTWLECCGHLSEFTLGTARYGGHVFGKGRRLDCLPVGATLFHAYDFGTTTTCRIRVAGEQQARVRPKSLELLARNERPPITCDACGAPATWVCVDCRWDDEGGWYCDEHAAEHECGEEMLLPSTNSPRVGECGYWGPEA